MTVDDLTRDPPPLTPEQRVQRARNWLDANGGIIDGYPLHNAPMHPSTTKASFDVAAVDAAEKAEAEKKKASKKAPDQAEAAVPAMIAMEL